MSTEDKGKNLADKAGATVKEAAGKVTGDDSLERDGRADKAKADAVGVGACYVPTPSASILGCTMGDSDPLIGPRHMAEARFVAVGSPCGRATAHWLTSSQPADAIVRAR